MLRIFSANPIDSTTADSQAGDPLNDSSASDGKLVRSVCRMLRYGSKFVDQGAKLSEAQHRGLQIKQIGFQVV